MDKSWIEQINSINELEEKFNKREIPKNDIQ